MNMTINPRGCGRFYSDFFYILRYNEDIPYTILIDAELSVVSVAIKMCILDNGVFGMSKIRSFFVGLLTTMCSGRRRNFRVQSRK